MAVMLGTELLEVGDLSHARWLTLACQILKCYIFIHQPSKEASILA